MLAIVAAILSSTCSVGPRYRVPAAPVPFAAAYKEANVGTWKVATPGDAIPRGAWWTMFHEPELDALQARIDINNQTIAQATEAYLAARAEVRIARAGYFPTVTGSPAVTRARSRVPGGGVATATSYSLAVDASWAPDLFGRVRNAVRQSRYDAQVSAADLESARLLAHTMLAQTYFQIRGQDALQELLDATVASNEQIAALTRTRFAGGLDAEASLVQAELTLQTSRVAATNAAILRAQYEHAIATLLGVPATDFSLPRRASLPAPPRIPTGAPSQLLERRPDIAAAERRMASANAAIGIGYAAYFPQLTLSGAVGLASSALGSVVSWPSRVWSIGAALSQTLFDGGQRRARIDQLLAVYNANVASYRQTVLVAFQQVEDQLVSVRVLGESIEQQRAAVALAEKAFGLGKLRYDQGLDPYIALMLDQIAMFEARQTLVGMQVEHMIAAVLLVQALGGGWSRAQLPTPSEVSRRR